MQSTSKGLKLEQVTAARDVLEALPPPSKESRLLSIKEAVQVLTPTVRKLFQRGHSRQEVLALLQEQGIDCSEWMLKTVFRAANPRAPKKAGPSASATLAPASLSAAARTRGVRTDAATASTQVVAQPPTTNGAGERKVEGPTAVGAASAAPSKASS
jgi:hypothetical protein